MNILVCGFMGSGKTTFVESFRGNSLGYLTCDLDHAVVESLGISYQELGEWINKFGLDKFREVEMEVLKTLLSQKISKIIALGGGTLEAPGFWELSDRAKLVFLDVPFEVCFSRVKNDRNRPLTALGQQGLNALYNKRQSLYKKADLTLDDVKIKAIEDLESLVHNLTSV